MSHSRLTSPARSRVGEVMSAHVTAKIPIGALPLLGHFGTITVHADASAPVDRYRSILERP